MAYRTQHHKHAMQNPGGVFAAPEDVLKDDDLSSEEKQQVLENWADEVKHILESQAENMRPNKETRVEEPLLQRITKTMASLRQQG